MTDTKLPLFFDTYGAPPYVLRAMDVHIPMIFGETSVPWLDQARENVSHHVSTNNWNYVAVNLSKGMAQHQLTELLDHDPKHIGPFVVDPTASTSDFQSYHSVQEIRACSSRLIRANDASDDILMIMYGMEQDQQDVQQDLLARRMRMAAATLELALKEEPGNEALQQRLTQALAMIRLALRTSGLVLDYSTMDSSIDEIVDLDGNRRSFALLNIYANILEAVDYTDDAILCQTLDSLKRSFNLTCQDFRDLGIDFSRLARASADATQTTVPAPAPLEAEARLDARAQEPRLNLR